MKFFVMILMFFAMLLGAAESVRADKASKDHVNRFEPLPHDGKRHEIRRDFMESVEKAAEKAIGESPESKPVTATNADQTSHSFWKGMEMLEKEFKDGMDAYHQKLKNEEVASPAMVRNMLKSKDASRREMEREMEAINKRAGIVQQSRTVVNDDDNEPTPDIEESSPFPSDDFEWGHDAAAGLSSLFD